MAKTPAQRAAKHGNKAGSPPDLSRSGTRSSPHPAPSRRRGSVAAPNPTTRRTPERAGSNANMIVIAGAVAGALLYAYELFVGLPELAGLAGGRAMPETMVFGYGPGYVEELRGAMNEPALNVYQHFHSTADTLFPLIFAFTWLLLMNQLLPKGRVRWFFFGVPVLYAGSDLAENALLDAMMRAQPFDAGLAGFASALTVAKFALFALCLIAAVAALLLARRGRLKATAS